MTSSYSNIWKRFLFSNQSTIYNNEKIEYTIQTFKEDNLNNNNELKKSIEQILIENLDYLIILFFMFYYVIKKNIMF